MKDCMEKQKSFMVCPEETSVSLAIGNALRTLQALDVSGQR